MVAKAKSRKWWDAVPGTGRWRRLSPGRRARILRCEKAMKRRWAKEGLPLLRKLVLGCLGSWPMDGPDSDEARREYWAKAEQICREETYREFPEARAADRA